MQYTNGLCRKSTKIATISIIIILVLLTSGCIHIDLGNPFHEPKPKITEYKIVTKEGFPIKHVFNFAEDPDFMHSQTKPFYVYKGTEWVNISIIIVINTYMVINNTPINLSFLERYVKITIKNPEGKVDYQKRFVESVEQLRPVDKPETGTWIVEVEAKGIGDDETYDYYEVNVVAYEPA